MKCNALLPEDGIIRAAAAAAAAAGAAGRGGKKRQPNLGVREQKLPSSLDRLSVCLAVSVSRHFHGKSVAAAAHGIMSHAWLPL